MGIVQGIGALALCSAAGILLLHYVCGMPWWGIGVVAVIGIACGGAVGVLVHNAEVDDTIRMEIELIDGKPKP